MSKRFIERLSAILFFLVLLVGAAFCLQRLAQDISVGRYFNQPDELRSQIIFLIAYVSIILFLLRYGYYLAVNRVSWQTIKDDLIYLLNRKYFSRFQWTLNMLLFWLALTGFIYSLTISTMRGSL